MNGLDKMLEYNNDTELRAKLPGVDSTYGRIGYDILFHLVSPTESMEKLELFDFARVGCYLCVTIGPLN